MHIKVCAYRHVYPHIHTFMHVLCIFSESDFWFPIEHLLGSSVPGPIIPAGLEAAHSSEAGLPVSPKGLTGKIEGRRRLVLKS